MNPKFALPVDTTEKRRRDRSGLSLRLRLDGSGHGLGGQGSRAPRAQTRSAHEGRLWPHEMVARGGHVFILYSSTPREEIDPRFVSRAGHAARAPDTKVLLRSLVEWRILV